MGDVRRLFLEQPIRERLIPINLSPVIGTSMVAERFNGTVDIYSKFFSFGQVVVLGLPVVRDGVRGV